MELPTQVQQHGEAADALEAEMLKAAEADAPTEQAVDADAPKPEEPAPEPQSDEAPPQPVVEAAKPTDETDWKQRYSTLQGMYNAEVPRLRAEVTSLTAEIERLKTASKADTPKEAAQPKTARQAQVTDKDVEDFGGDLVSLAKRAAADVISEREEALTAANAKLEAELAALKERVGDVTETKSADRKADFFVKLGQLVPNYMEINANEGFLKWLGEIDPVSGQQRQTHLEAAVNANDAVRTATLFDTWSALQVPPVPAKDPELERQIAPGTSKSSAPPAQPQLKTFTTQEVETFYREVSQGKWRDRVAEAAQVEADIDRALAEGRIK